MNYIQENFDIRNSFSDYFSQKGYTLEPGVTVASKIDPTVFLVGNATNVFKQYFLNKNINKSGHALIQPAINSKYLPDPNIGDVKRFFSTYTSFGILANYSNLDQMVYNTYEFFNKVVGLDKISIQIKVNDMDEDFLSATKNIKDVTVSDNNRRINGFGTYKNIPISGRNMRFDYNGRNICVLSVYEYNGDNLGIEATTTLEVLLTEKYNLQNTMQTSVLNSIQVAQNGFELKYYDCITAISELIVSNVFPNSSHMDGRILKKYLNALKVLEQKCNKSHSDTENCINFYLDTFYKNKNVSNNIKRVLTR